MPRKKKSQEAAPSAPSKISDALPAHSQLGASSAHRWMACPGSVRLSRDIPSRSSKYAEEGTEAHELAAKILLNQAAHHDDEEMLEHVRVYVDYVMKARGEAEALIEHKFNLEKVYPGLFGTCDAVILDDKNSTIKVVDFKYGAGIPVDVTDNVQLKYYALGAYLSSGRKFDRVDLVIVQPRCSHPDGPVRTYSLDSLELLDFAVELVDFAQATEDPFAPTLPGDHCRFCPANGVCEAVKGKAQALAKTVFSNELVPPDGGSGYNPVELAKTLEWLPVIEAWVKNVRDFAYGEATCGRGIPGFKLVAKRATRKWKDEALVRGCLKEMLSEETYRQAFDFTLKSPTQMEKYLAEKPFSKLEPLIVKESSGTVLVPTADKRPEVKHLSAAEAFEDVFD